MAHYSYNKVSNPGSGNYSCTSPMSLSSRWQLESWEEVVNRIFSKASRQSLLVSTTHPS